MEKALILLLAAFFVSGCANWGQTEPVLSGDGRDRAVQPEAKRHVVYLQGGEAAPASVSKTNRELAAVKADLDAMREEQKLLGARIAGLEQDNARKDERIKELQSLLDAIDRRFADVDKDWRRRMNELNSTIDAERVNRKRELDNFTNVITSEINKGQTPAAGSYTILAVQRGDTLSAIATAAKVSIAELKRINNLKSDVIYEGQKLKVPMNH